MDFLFVRLALKKNADYLFDNQRFLGEPLARLELATYALRSLHRSLYLLADS